MGSRLLDLPVFISGYSICSVAVAVAAIFVVARSSQPSKLETIPTVGSNSWLGSWWAGLKFFTNALDVIQEGYEKHNGAPFKIAGLRCWMVVLGSREHVEELRRAPDDTLSFLEGINEQLQIEFTSGREFHHNPYHIAVLRARLTRGIKALYPETRNEITTAFDELLDLNSNEWKSVSALGSAQTIVCRASNRLFVGLPLCRDPDWVDLNIQYALHVVNGALIIQLFPTLLKPLAARLFTKITESNARGRRLLRPIIEERQRYLTEHGNQWADKPNDLLSWLMEEAEGPELTVEALTARVLGCNFVAIHTSSTSFTNALLYLAANPQYIQPLREEVETIVEKEGWTEAAVGKMRKIDSFFRESERMQGFSGVSLIRKAMKDFTFSDSTFIPKGTRLAAATRSVHYDEALYPNAHTFEPFRFVGPHDEDGEGVKHQFASTAPEYLAFGLGRHACPGRFFAATELKSMLAHVVVTYDVKLEENTTRPRTLSIGTAMTPDPNAKVMFRRRAD